MSRAPDTIVAGGGIAGLCTALALADRGHRVTVIDEARPGAASRASAGMLAAGLGFAPAVAVHARAARDAYPAFLEQLRDAAGIAVPLDRQGILELAADDAAFARLRGAAGSDAAVLDARELADLEPGLLAHPGALLHHADGAVDAARLMEALHLATARHPGVLRVTSAVQALELGGQAVRVRTADGGRHAGGRVVLATGAWAGALSGLPRALPIRPVRGQLLRLAGSPTRHVVYGGGGYLIPRGGSLLVGATSEDAGFDAGTTEAGRATLLGIARRLVGGAAARSMEDHWAALRPMTPDNLPILGPDPTLPAVVYACGLSRNGILFAPWAAERIAAGLSGERDDELAVFGVERFGSRGFISASE